MQRDLAWAPQRPRAGLAAPDLAGPPSPLPQTDNMISVASSGKDDYVSSFSNIGQ